jgi:hypothetical protein
MARKRQPPEPAPRAPNGNGSARGYVPNLSLSRAARAGEHTEDELLLQRPKRPQPVPRVREQAAFTHDDPEDLGLVTVTDSTEEACRVLLEAYLSGPPH